MEYKFYIQRYAHKYWSPVAKAYQELPKSDVYNLEEKFKCKYVRMEGIAENGKVKNVYTESYAEDERLRVCNPQSILYDNTDVSLTLLFLATENNEMDIQNGERDFFEFVSGRQVEFHDTFRNRYISLILLNKPEVVGEVLYGDNRYRQVKYTFKNIYGRSFSSSQIG